MKVGTESIFRVFIMAYLCALPAFAPAADHKYRHVASNDGKGHCVHVLPERAEVLGPGGAWPPDYDGGPTPLMLGMYCREGAEPIRVNLSFPRHPTDPPTQKLLSDELLSVLWRNLVEGDPAVQEELRIVLGDSEFTATAVRALTSYSTETDYQALLPARETAREIVDAAGGTLTIEMQGPSIRGTAVYAITEEFAWWVDEMRSRCGT